MPTIKEPRPAWLDAVEEFLQYFESRGYVRAAGATDEELQQLRRESEDRGLHFDEQWLALLRYVNGVSFAGVSFPGTNADENDPKRRSKVLFFNDPEFDFTDGDATVYGTSDLDTYRYSKSTGRFEVFGDGEVWECYESFAELAQYAFGNVDESVHGRLKSLGRIASRRPPVTN